MFRLCFFSIAPLSLTQLGRDLWYSFGQLREDVSGNLVDQPASVKGFSFAVRFFGGKQTV
jgi:hypothetical protein